MTLPSAWQCSNGATPTLTPEPQTLQDDPTETRDFRVSCTAPSAGTSTSSP